MVSGRPVAEIDHWLQPLRLPVAGVHGAERRGPDGFLRRIATPDLTPARALVEELVRRHPALLLEVKPGALALHYRQADALEDECLDTMTEALRRVEGLALLCGKKVVELKPRRASKGQAVRAFLDERPFRSRRPWVFGDDVTDEVAFETVLGLGGVAVKVGAGETLAPYRLADPAALQALAGFRAGPVRGALHADPGGRLMNPERAADHDAATGRRLQPSGRSAQGGVRRACGGSRRCPRSPRRAVVRLERQDRGGGKPGEGDSTRTSRQGEAGHVDLEREDHDSITLAIPMACCGRCSITAWTWPTSMPATSAATAASPAVRHKLAGLLRADDLIWVHDYHLIPLAAELRALGCRHRIGFFLHIPCRRR